MADAITFNFIEGDYSPPELLEFEFGPVIVYNIIPGANQNFTSVWADSNANISNAKFYTASQGEGAAFAVIDLSSHTLSDYYTLTFPGYNEEVLEREDIVDININTAGA
jgi:hypothetical protein